MRHQGWNYAGHGWYYVTICTNERHLFFGEVDEEGAMHLNAISEIVKECWLLIPHFRSYVELDEWVIMPHHLHGILVINREEEEKLPRRWQKGSLGAIVNQFKGATTKHIRAMGGTPFAWQRNFYDHIIRNEKDLKRIRTYIINNPEETFGNA